MTVTVTSATVTAANALVSVTLLLLLVLSTPQLLRAYCHCLHQLGLVQFCDPSLQLLRVFGKEVELGTVALRMLARIVVSDLSCKSRTQN